MSTTRWLIQFGYDGSRFAGWARQPLGRTVEGEIRAGLVRTGLARSAESARVAVASRTDRGVSARGNALTLSSSLEGPALLRALNAIAPEIFFRAAARVPEEFDPRKASRRWYRYFQATNVGTLAEWRENTICLTGRLDVRSFGRGLPEGHPTWRDVERWSISNEGNWFVVDVWAPSFVWGMVRKMVTTLRQLASGELDRSEVEAAVRGDSRLAVPLAEPEPLVLWQVEYPIPWEYRSARLSRRRSASTTGELLRAEVRSEVLRRLWDEENEYRGPDPVLPPKVRG